MTNFLTGSNTDFESGVGHWVAGASAALASTTAQAQSGTHSCSITTSAAVNGQAFSCTAATITTNGMPCIPGDSVYCSGWFRANSVPRTCLVRIGFYTAAGALIGSNIQVASGTDTTTGWTFLDGTATAPDTAAFCRVANQINSMAIGEVHYLDDAVLARSSATSMHVARFLMDLFDGASV